MGKRNYGLPDKCNFFVSTRDLHELSNKIKFQCTRAVAEQEWDSRILPVSSLMPSCLGDSIIRFTLLRIHLNEVS